MTDRHDEELIRLLQRLGEVRPASEATSRALERVRRVIEQNQVLSLPSRKRRRLQPYAAAAAAAVLLAGSVLTWLTLPSPAPGFAKVQAAMRSPGSVICTQTTRIKGEPEVVIHLYMLGNGLCRAEKSDGSYTITDASGKRKLVVDLRNREVEYWQGINSLEANEYQAILNLESDAAARALPPKKMNGHEAVGILVSMRGRDYTVWAKAKDRRPERIEVAWKDEQGRAAETVIDQFLFDRELDPGLFTFDLPRGLKLKTNNGPLELPSAPQDPRLKDLVVTPLVGLGPVKLGMAAAEVEALFGKPDKKVEEPTKGISKLTYSSQGFSIHVSKDSRVWAISCVAQAAVTGVRDFYGHTDKGIRLGATKADIVQQYGVPDTEETQRDQTFLGYKGLQTHFTLFGDRLVQIWCEIK